MFYYYIFQYLDNNANIMFIVVCVVMMVWLLDWRYFDVYS